jgi:hypothetical protein
MPYYRLYHLDLHTGHINSAEEVHAPDDVAAIHSIQQGQSEHPLELWQEGRKVVRIDATPMMAASPSPYTTRGTLTAWRGR